jgi:hypothetical protein
VRALDVRERTFRICLFVAAASVTTPRFLSASERARSYSLAYTGGSARVHVPKTYAPVLPGSVYPDRKKPVAARACPVAVVEGPLGFARLLREELLERGFLVVETGRAGRGSLAPLLDALNPHPEADPARAVFIGRELPEANARDRLAAAVLFEPAQGAGSPPPAAAPGPASVAVFLRTPARVPSATLTRELQGRFGPGVVEKWYRAEEDFPSEAFRDAAEWAFTAVSKFR